MLKMSIVTASYNQCDFIEDCLRSVQSQVYPAVEHIVVDGGSTDGTVEILRRYSEMPGWQHLRWVSEKDRGQSDALNKGFRMATGDIIGWLNSDDLYSPDCFRTVSQAFLASEDNDLVYGDYAWTNGDGEVFQIRREIPFSRFIFRYNHMNFIQSSGALFLRKDIIADGYLLDEAFHYAMDYEFCLRLANADYCFKHVPVVLGSFRWHADSKTTLHARLERKEEDSARQRHVPILKRMRSPYARQMALFVLLPAATCLRWGQKAVRGYYFSQFRAWRRKAL